MTGSRRIVGAFGAGVLLSTLAAPVAGAEVGVQTEPVAVTAVECPNCADSDPCTADSCDPLTGFCRHAPPLCDDGDPCTVDVCNNRFAINPGCENIHLRDGSTCSAAGVCVGAGVCVAGSCQATPAAEGSSCDDALPCTDGDVCDGAGACIAGWPSPAGTPCSDGDACSEGETCGLDDLGAPVCRGAVRSCDDGDACTDDACGADSCLNTPISCDDGNGCTADACERGTGACVHTATREGLGCQGSSPCFTSSCVAGNCMDTGSRCDDHIFCTRDYCNAQSPLLCQHIPDSSLCPQDGPCAIYGCDLQTGMCRGFGSCMLDQCTRGQCDTRGFCLPTGGTSGSPCDDGNACTTNDTCGGGCQGTPISCDDGIACTIDLCDPANGCAHAYDPGACDDRNDCTQDSCLGDGTCDHQSKPSGSDCDDGNPCTEADLCAVAPSGGTLCLGTDAGPRPQTCGVGACERALDTCVDGVHQPCVPGEPAVETCNGVDDDCDGHVDENRLRATCLLRPIILLDRPTPTKFTVACELRDRCHGNLPLSPAGIDADAVWISRADGLANGGDNVNYPDPASLACPDPQAGTAWEPGIVETVAVRATDARTARFEFSTPHDGECSTFDGDRAALLDRLSGTPIGPILVCVSGRYDGAPWEGCAPGFLRR